MITLTQSRCGKIPVSLPKYFYLSLARKEASADFFGAAMKMKKERKIIPHNSLLRITVIINFVGPVITSSPHLILEMLRRTLSLVSRNAVIH